MIENKRVDSKLAVSRAFGDSALKNNGSILFREQRVTSLMETTKVVASAGDRLFLFCDGLVEYLDNGQLVDTLYRHVPLYQDPVYALGFTFDDVLEGGSRDNMSAILVQFADGRAYGLGGRQKTFLPGPLFLGRNDRKYVAAYLSNAKDFGHRDSPMLRRAAYREDLKLLAKYGQRSQERHGRQQDVVEQIESVILEIDRRNGACTRSVDTVQSVDSGPRRGSTKVIQRGSTKVIEDDDEVDDEVKDALEERTPPLSDLDDEDEIDLNLWEDEEGRTPRIESETESPSFMASELTLNPESELTLNPESESESKCDLYGDGKPKMTRKRTFADLEGVAADESPSAKRRKSNIGKAIC